MSELSHPVLQQLAQGELVFGIPSGVLTTKPGLIKRIDKEVPEIGIITTKSFTPKPLEGYREPILAEINPGDFVNAVGLRNPGFKVALKELIQLRKDHKMRALLNVSIAANSPEDFAMMAKEFDKVADTLELNFSCPHAAPGFGAAIGTSPELVKEYVEAVAKVSCVPIIAKLPPVANIGEIALAAIKGGAEGIAAINTVGPYRPVHVSGEHQFNNPRENQGGKSGGWIFENAVVAIREIAKVRKEHGIFFPIFGIGGVRNGEDVIKLKRAGADAIFIGTSLGLVHPEARSAYLQALKKGENAEEFLPAKKSIHYDQFKIQKIREMGKDLRMFTCEGELLYDATQFAFIWLLGIGEKPFCIMRGNRPRFLIRKRPYDKKENKGLFTNAVFKLKVGDKLWVRGPYGVKPKLPENSNVFIAVAGTGVAVVPKLVQQLQEKNNSVEVYFGISKSSDLRSAAYLRLNTPVHIIQDLDHPGEVLSTMSEMLKRRNTENAIFYTIGPQIFMDKAMALAESIGLNEGDIHAVLEKRCSCGVGICGECECGGKLCCKEGTTFSYDYLKEHEGQKRIIQEPSSGKALITEVSQKYFATQKESL